MRYFLGLLQGGACSGPSLSDEQADSKTRIESQITTDKVFLEDFRVAAKVRLQRQVMCVPN